MVPSPPACIVCMHAGHRQFSLEPTSDTESDADDGGPAVKSTQMPGALQTAACIWRLDCDMPAAAEAPAGGDAAVDASVCDALAAVAEGESTALEEPAAADEAAMQEELPAAPAQAPHAVGGPGDAQGPAEELLHAAVVDEAVRGAPANDLEVIQEKDIHLMVP